MEVPTYTYLDEEYADNYFKDTYYNWGGGCSAIVKTITDPDGTERTIIGRNMDLNISNKCAYIVRTEVPGKNKTFGLAYTFRDISDDYDIVKEKGITDQFYKVLPFMCDDVMNDKGLHIEINMRNGEYWPNGEDKFACEGTNSLSEHKVYMFELTRYIAENCNRVSEVPEYIKSLNIYSKKGYWNYAFLISDCTGDYGLLELYKDELTGEGVHWQHKENCQTNFYVDLMNFYKGREEYNPEELCCGMGRYNTLKDGIDDVDSKIDMMNLMRKVSYSQIYDCYTCPFDVRGELVGTMNWATYQYIMNPEYEDLYKDVLYLATADYRSMTRQQRRDANSFWESTFTEVADTKDLSIEIRFFEDESLIFKVDFDGVTPLLRGE